MLGDIEDGVATALTRELHNHLPGADDFARFGAGRGNGAGGVGVQDRVALLFARDLHLSLGGVDLGLGGQKLLLGLVEIGAGSPAVLQEFLLPPEGQARLGQHRLKRGEIGFCRAQRIVLNLGVEPGDHLTCGEPVADMNRPLDHSSVEAKSQADLVLRANLAGQRHDLAFRALIDSDRSNRPGLRDRRRRFVAACDGCREQDCCCNLSLEHWCCLSQER